MRARVLACFLAQDSRDSVRPTTLYAVLLYVFTITELVDDALIALRAHNVSFVSFWDFAGGNFAAVMGIMECKFQGRNSEIMEWTRGARLG